MYCSDCLFYELNINDYPCSECTNKNMFERPSSSMMCLINEVRQLKELVLELKHSIEKESSDE